LTVTHDSAARAALFALEQIGIKLGLDQIRALVDALGHPDRAYPSIVVAGTNGKGSVAAMTERGLRAAGYRTGRYTSPHLVDLEERFAVDGEPISSAHLDGLAARVMEAAKALPAPPSFFEATTAVALEAFRDARVDVAVLEVGLGGRLDATNVVDSIAEAITMIDFDHQQYLGGTIEAIAREKAAVIKPGSFVVLAPNPPAVDRIAAEAADAAGARLIRAGDDVEAHAEMRDGHAWIDLRTPRGTYANVRLGLAGRHQIENAIVAVRLLETLPETTRLQVSSAAIRTALEDVVWPARLEMRRLRDLGMFDVLDVLDVLIDGAHNAAGARALAAHVRETFGRPLPFVVGLMSDKDADAILGALAPVASAFFCTSAHTPRAAAPEDVAAVAARVAPAIETRVAADPLAAVRAASARGRPVVVAGSLYLAGEVRRETS
jgi:dihydrofolate synthase/folylpolyglutamate synthase